MADIDPELQKEMEELTGDLDKTTKKLQDCEYYPPSLIVKKERDWNILELEDDQYYYCKPKYGCQSKNISVCLGKEFIVNQKLEYPFVIQDEKGSISHQYSYALPHTLV